MFDYSNKKIWFCFRYKNIFLALKKNIFDNDILNLPNFDCNKIIFSVWLHNYEWIDLSRGKVLNEYSWCFTLSQYLFHQFLISEISKDKVPRQTANNSRSTGSLMITRRVISGCFFFAWRFSWRCREPSAAWLFKSTANRRGGNFVLSIILFSRIGDRPQLTDSLARRVHSPRDFPRFVPGSRDTTDKHVFARQSWKITADELRLISPTRQPLIRISQKSTIKAARFIVFRNFPEFLPCDVHKIIHSSVTLHDVAFGVQIIELTKCREFWQNLPLSFDTHAMKLILTNSSNRKQNYINICTVTTLHGYTILKSTANISTC